MSKDDKWCFAWYQDPRVSDAEKKAALVKDSKWPTPNPTISVGFMDGTPQQKELVKRFAEGWKNDSQGKLANLTFNWTLRPSTHPSRSSPCFRPDTLACRSWSASSPETMTAMRGTRLAC